MVRPSPPAARKAAAAKKAKATKAKTAKAAGKKAASRAHAAAGRQTRQNTTQSPSKADAPPNSPTLRRSRRVPKQKDCFSGAEPKSYVSTSIEEGDADADKECASSGDEHERDKEEHARDKEEPIADRTITIEKRKSRARKPSATSSGTHTGSRAQASNTTDSTEDREDREHAINLAIQSVLKKQKIDPTFISGIGNM